MLKELKYLFFFLIILMFIFFSIKYYVSDENKKKTFKNLILLDKKLNLNNPDLPIIPDDTDKIVNYLVNDNSLNKKKYSFWDLLKKWVSN